MMEKARSMLNDASLSQDYWAEAVGTSCFIMNKSLTLDLVENNPYEVWNGKRSSLAHPRVFACESFVEIKK